MERISKDVAFDKVERNCMFKSLGEVTEEEVFEGGGIGSGESKNYINLISFAREMRLLYY